MIRDRFEEVLEALDAEIGLSNYTIARYNVYAAPSFYITYESEGFDRQQAKELADIFVNKFGIHPRVVEDRNRPATLFGSSVETTPMIHIGGIYTRAKVRFWDVKVERFSIINRNE